MLRPTERSSLGHSSTLSSHFPVIDDISSWIAVFINLEVIHIDLQPENVTYIVPLHRLLRVPFDVNRIIIDWKYKREVSERHQNCLLSLILGCFLEED